MKPLASIGLFSVCVFLSACKVDSTLTVSYEGKGSISDGGKIDCPTNCEAEYTHSAHFYRSVRLTAQAAPGYEFFGWERCGAEQRCQQQLEAVCGSAKSLCLAWQADNDVAHAIFVPEGSIVDSARSKEGDKSCLINTNGELRCWPEHFDAEKPLVKNPSKVKISDNSACVVDDTGMQCWGNQYVADQSDAEFSGIAQ